MKYRFTSLKSCISVKATYCSQLKRQWIQWRSKTGRRIVGRPATRATTWLSSWKPVALASLGEAYSLQLSLGWYLWWWINCFCWPRCHNLRFWPRSSRRDAGSWTHQRDQLLQLGGFWWLERTFPGLRRERAGGRGYHQRPAPGQRRHRLQGVLPWSECEE